MHSQSNESRREFLRHGTTVTVAGIVGAGTTEGTASPVLSLQDEGSSEKSGDKKRHRVGSIGTGGRWQAVGKNAAEFADLVAVCDVDSNHLQKAIATVKKIQGTEPTAYADYQELLKRDDIDVVVIVTPDHWHSKIAIEALHAGKDVYCEKPLTLTIEEGNRIIEAVEQTGRVFQVGTQQRSEFNQRFLTAVAICRAGRLGKLQKTTCVIGGAPTSESLPAVDPPVELDWDRWLGPAPLTEFRSLDIGKPHPITRAHNDFRWWYEYSGGKMTDWGAHHIDIAQWAFGFGDTGPIRITPKQVTHPVELDSDGMPTDPSRFNTATEFTVECEYKGGEILEIASGGRNGLLIEGDEGRIFVSRNDLSGAPVEALATNPLPSDLIETIYKGKKPSGGNAQHAQLLRLHRIPRATYQRCLFASPNDDRLPPRQHRSATGTRTPLGS